jgi:hypothetical protein
MPTYTFQLNDGAGGVADETGITLQDRADALRYSQDVIQELMSHRERETRSWRLDVYENDHNRIFQIPFASLDRSLDHLRPEWRGRVESLCEHNRSLQEVLHAARLTVRESRALVARSRGKPYLAAEFGEPTIREK